MSPEPLHDGRLMLRLARAEDIPEMAGVFLTSATDMFARHGIATALPPRPVVERGYEHVRTTGSFRVAESEGRIVAIAGAVVRERQWYLSAFWALPGLQGRNIGMPLLRQVWQDGVDVGANTFFTWSSVDTTAMAAYMKLGMLPGYPILLFEGVPRPMGETSDSEAMVLEPGVAEALDQEVRGTRREADHRLWGQVARGRQVVSGKEVVGYYYVNGGAIGPVAWRRPENAAAVLAKACRDAAEASPAIRLAVPGVNHTALAFAYGAGLRLTSFAHLLSNRPFGRMEQYLPSGPSLF